MANFSDVLDAKVISKADCSVCGIVRDAYFDEKCKNIAYFILDSDGAERLLPIEEVVSFSDALMIADNLALISPYDIDRTAYMKQPVGKEVFTRGGKLKGCVRDVVFSAKGKVNSLLVDDTVCSPGRFESFGDVILLAGDTPARKRRKLPLPDTFENKQVQVLADDTETAAISSSGKTDAPAIAEIRETPSVVAVPTNSVNVSPAANAREAQPLNVFAAQPEDTLPVFIRDAMAEVNVSADNGDFTPHRIIADYNFLLGRTLQDDLLSYTGETLARKNSAVTVDMVELARRHGKLIELTLNSK